MAVHVPVGVYSVCNLFLGDKTQGLCPSGSECLVPSRVYGDAANNYFFTTIQAAAGCGASSSDFVIQANTASKFRVESLRIDGGATSTAGTGASCADFSWKSTNGAAVQSQYRDLMLSNCKDASGSYSIDADNDGSSTLPDIYVLGATSTGNQTAVSTIATGDVISWHRVQIYNKGLAVVDAQNWDIADSYLYGACRSATQ